MKKEYEQWEEEVQKAAEFFWNTRRKQGSLEEGQQETEAYVGRRAQVTGGKQLDGFVDLLRDILIKNKIKEENIFVNSDLELPGFYRPNKKWDLLVVEDNRLLVAIELKSQVGPSFANNFNNRTEEAMGSALDIWTAYREGAFGLQPPPWLGYLMVLEDCEKSTKQVKNRQPHFPVFSEFEHTSYMDRYELFCKKLMLERQYSHTCFLTTKREQGKVNVSYPSSELSFGKFVHAMLVQIRGER